MSSANPNDILSAYYDGEVTPNEEEAARALVEGSSEGSREVKDYARLSRLIRALPKLSATPEFAAAVMQRAERESLIPLDPVAAAQSAGQVERFGSRRRWILAAVTSVAVVAALLIAINFIGPRPAKGPEAVAVRDSASRPTAELEGRKASPFADALAAKHREDSDRPLAPVAKTADKKAVLVQSKLAGAPAMVAAPARGKDAAKASVDESIAKSQLGLMLPANLKTAKVGDVVEALQQDGRQVAVVRLTVVNQVEGLDGVQSLLVRNTSRTLQNAEEIKRMRQQFAPGNSTAVPKSAVPSAPGDLICVYVEGSRDEMLGVLQDLQNERHIQAAELTNTISFTMLEQFAGSAVPTEKQGAEGAGSQSGMMAKGAVVQAPKPPGSQLAVSLPASTVNKILGGGQSVGPGLRQTSDAPAPAQVAQQDQSELDSSVHTLNEIIQQADTKKSPAKKNQGQAAVPAQQPSPSRSVAGKSRSRSRNSQQVAGESKSFQIFFVITDQAQAPQAAPNAAPTQSAPATPAPAKAPH